MYIVQHILNTFSRHFKTTVHTHLLFFIAPDMKATDRTSKDNLIWTNSLCYFTFITSVILNNLLIFLHAFICTSDAIISGRTVSLLCSLHLRSISIDRLGHGVRYRDRYSLAPMWHMVADGVAL